MTKKYVRVPSTEKPMLHEVRRRWGKKNRDTEGLGGGLCGLDGMGIE